MKYLDLAHQTWAYINQNLPSLDYPTSITVTPMSFVMRFGGHAEIHSPENMNECEVTELAEIFFVDCHRPSDGNIPLCQIWLEKGTSWIISSKVAHTLKEHGITHLLVPTSVESLVYNWMEA